MLNKVSNEGRRIGIMATSPNPGQDSPEISQKRSASNISERSGSDRQPSMTTAVPKHTDFRPTLQSKKRKRPNTSFESSADNKQRRPENSQATWSPSTRVLEYLHATFFHNCVYLPLPDHIEVAEYMQHLEEIDRRDATTWSEEFHRNFCLSVWKIGVEHATPSILYRGMQAASQASTMTMDRVKSHLQKYRQYKANEEQHFLHEYDQYLGYLQEIESRRMEGMHLIRLESILGARAAAYATHWIRKEAKRKENAATTGVQACPDSVLDQIYMHVISPDGYGAGRLFFPLLSEQEESSALGSSLRLVYGLLEYMNHHLAEERRKCTNRFYQLTKAQHNESQTSTSINNNARSKPLAVDATEKYTANLQPKTIFQQSVSKAPSSGYTSDSSSSSSSSDSDSDSDSASPQGTAIEISGKNYDTLELGDTQQRNEEDPLDTIARLGSAAVAVNSDKVGTIESKTKQRKAANPRIRQQTRLASKILLEFEDSAINSLQLDGIRHVKSDQKRPRAFSSEFEEKTLSSPPTSSRNSANLVDFHRTGLPMDWSREPSHGIVTGTKGAKPNITGEWHSDLSLLGDSVTMNTLGGQSKATEDSIFQFLGTARTNTQKTGSRIGSISRKFSPLQSLEPKARGVIKSSDRMIPKHKNPIGMQRDDAYWDDSSIDSDETFQNNNTVSERIDAYMDQIFKLDTTLKQNRQLKATTKKYINFEAKSQEGNKLEALHYDSDESSEWDGDQLALRKFPKFGVGRLMEDDLISFQSDPIRAQNEPKIRNQPKHNADGISTLSFQTMMQTIFPGKNNDIGKADSSII